MAEVVGGVQAMWSVLGSMGFVCGGAVADARKQKFCICGRGG
jgi:hypothetical protein